MLSVGPREAGRVELKNVRRLFGDLEVLGDVNLTVESGTVAAIVGFNGSGKTSLLRIVAGVLAPSDGEVRVCGSPPGRGRTGYAPAGDRALHWRLSGRHNLAFLAALGGASDDVVGMAVEAVGARSFLDRSVGECSTGQRRRLVVAQALVSSPPVLLLDEPYADLDEEGTACVRAVVGRWAESGGTVLVAAPAPDLAPPADVVLELPQSVPKGGSG